MAKKPKPSRKPAVAMPPKKPMKKPGGKKSARA